MRLQKTIPVVLAVFMLILALPEAGLSAGKFRIKPKLTLGWQMDDNYYKAQTNEREVYAYLLQPGVELGYETPKSLILLNYTLNAYWYDDRDALRPGELPVDRNDYVGHTGILEARTRPTDRLTLGLSDFYDKTRDPSSSDVFSNATDRDKYYINRVTPLIEYGFGPKFTAGLKYRYTELNYYPVNREDSTEERPIFDLIYNFNRTTALDLEYQHWTRDYDKNTSDYTSDQVKMILRKQYKYFALEAGAGYQEREFDDPTLQDLDAFTYRVGLVGQNPPVTEGPPRSRLALGAEQNINNAGSGDSYYIATRYILDAGYTYMQKVPLGIRISYQEFDYERTYGLTPAGVLALWDEDLLTIEGSIGYIVTDWLVFTLTGGNEERDSNIAGRNYENKYIMAGLEFSYDVGKQH